MVNLLVELGVVPLTPLILIMNDAHVTQVLLVVVVQYLTTHVLRILATVMEFVLRLDWSVLVSRVIVFRVITALNVKTCIVIPVLV